MRELRSWVCRVNAKIAYICYMYCFISHGTRHMSCETMRVTVSAHESYTTTLALYAPHIPHARPHAPPYRPQRPRTFVRAIVPSHDIRTEYLRSSSITDNSILSASLRMHHGQYVICRRTCCSAPRHVAGTCGGLVALGQPRLLPTLSRLPRSALR